MGSGPFPLPFLLFNIDAAFGAGGGAGGDFELILPVEGSGSPSRPREVGRERTEQGTVCSCHRKLCIHCVYITKEKKRGGAAEAESEASRRSASVSGFVNFFFFFFFFFLIRSY